MSDQGLCNKNEFEGKVAIVTGGGRGIGKALSRALAVRGAAVGILGRTEATLSKLVDELNSEGHRAIGLTCDVADQQRVEQAIATVVGQFGDVDILVNNAGLYSPEYHRDYVELGVSGARRIFDVNVMGMLACALACQPAMTRRGGGVIVNISSVAAYFNENAYAVSKIAVNGLTVSLARQFVKYNIRVNGIAPGLILTDEMHEEHDIEWLQTFTHDYMKNNQLIQRIAGPEEVAKAMLYLCSDNSSFITGETMRVSGGYPLIA
jgi:NAD(P)-dependent dehydrogenase (short-subunit alcohol dehydrogenase family)